MNGLLNRLGRGLKGVGTRLQERGTPRYFHDPQGPRDVIITELCRKIVAGEPWETVIHDPRAARHGERLPEYTYICDLVRRRAPRTLLDVGCVLNNAAFDRFIPETCAVSFLNPASEPIARRSATYHKAPLDEFSGRRFPLVTCLSTLEHIGFDNTRYGADFKDLGWDWPEAIACICRSVENLLRLVEPGGDLVVSCPYGRKEFVRLPPGGGVRVWQVLHTEHVAALRAMPALAGADFVVTRLTAQGWERAAADAEFAPFGAIGPGASGLLLLHVRC
jgi:hypothetical protein